MGAGPEHVVSCSVAKEAVRTVLKDVVAQSRPIAELRSTALFNPERDTVIRSSTSFDAANVIYDNDRIFGDGVNVAARLEGIAEPGSICVSGKVHEEMPARFPP